MIDYIFRQKINLNEMKSAHHEIQIFSVKSEYDLILPLYNIFYIVNVSFFKIVLQKLIIGSLEKYISC